MDLTNVRNEFKRQSLKKSMMNPNPIFQLEKWLGEARDNECPEYTAMSLATSTNDGQPSLRIVLLKLLWQDGLYFFTNYKSRKGRELAINNKAAALLFWPKLERQVKIEGVVSKVDSEISDQYFNSRPLESRISALVSQQSKEVESKKILEELWLEELAKWKEQDPPRPDSWGGYRLKPTRIEFWQGGEHRLHDRIVYKLVSGNWIITRLAP